MAQSNGVPNIKPSTPNASLPNVNNNQPMGNVNNNVNSNGVNQNVNNTIQGAQRNRANEGLVTANRGKTNSNISNGNSKSSNSSGVNNDAGGGQAVNPQNAERKLQAAKQAVKQKAAEQAIKKIALSAGVPEPVTEKALKTEKGKRMLQTMIDAKKHPVKAGKELAKNAASSLPGIPGLIGKAASKIDDAKENEKESDKKEMRKQSEAASGDISFEIDPSTLKKIVIFAPIAVFMISFVVIIIALISNDKVSHAVVAQMSSKADKDSLKEGHKQVKEDMGEYEIDDDDLDQMSGNGTSSGYGGAIDDFPKEYQERFRNLGNAFSSELECKNEKCFESSEFKYYAKIADIATRYRNKYNVSLDWYLISATNTHFSDTLEERMKKNLGGYNEADVENYDTLTSLDWDYDYKKISGYQYLDASNSQYDLQILAKNMVKKKTTQSCIDSNGNVISSQEDEDVEDIYFSSGGEKRLNCSSGTYEIHSTYTVDMDKYKEFMLEYIDKKMYTAGTGNSSTTPSNCITSSDKYIWPVGSKETTTTDGKKFALGKPESVQITSYYGSKEGFRTSGHGAIDISSNGNSPGVVNVIAAKGGKVVYPTNKSQTSYADNGYLGNNDGYGYGNHVIIDHGDGLYTLYGHLAKDSINVMAGDTVSQGQVIAKLGNSGNSTGAHLHFEMRKGQNSSSNRVDPLGYVDPNDPRLGVSSTSCSGSSGMGSAFVNLALAQLNDPSAYNGQKYWSYLGFSGRIEWCAAYVSWVVNNTEYEGKKMSDIVSFKSASVAQWMNYFYNTEGLQFKYNDNCSKYTGKNGSSSKYVPKQGDIIFFDWNQSWNGAMPVGYADHIGIVQKVEGDRIITIEGNNNNSVRESSYPLNSCQVSSFGSWY